MLIKFANAVIAATTNMLRLTQPRAIAVAPTSLLTVPYPISWAVVATATEAVCCHIMDTNAIREHKMSAESTILKTGREGKGFTSLSEPRSSVSSCQPGKVASRAVAITARTIAMILLYHRQFSSVRERMHYTVARKGHAFRRRPTSIH